MKILVLGDFEDVYQSTSAAYHLKKKGYEIISVTRPIEEQEMIQLAEGTDAIVLVRERTTLDRKLISMLRDVKLISQTGKGTAHLDLDALKDHDIEVTTTPGGSASSVVELTIGLMIGAARQFPLHQKLIEDDRWVQTPGMELNGKQLGILGYGTIGKRVAQVGTALGMNIKVWRPTGSETEVLNDNMDVGTLEEVLKTSDVLSLHMRYSPEWKGFLSKERLQLLKNHAIFINTSRAAFVDEKALAQLIRSRKLAGAGIDVFSEEPLVHNPYKGCDNIILTPHIGYITAEVLQRFAEAALYNIDKFFSKTDIL
ncbi:NAD(P)-dependent oxidoreductase [Evansella halocellulosilytica]|uniref:NAD(P)-dependent oxidoreductase n=1 Tax=Evansella halocellulosilytica TaxID=2011013 RepID=UPI000BB685BE|nr:NAD(P)-dependent oxidoreductase [Evansella halocellulosilytica]